VRRRRSEVFQKSAERLIEHLGRDF
jgi:hypothetical protein